MSKISIVFETVGSEGFKVYSDQDFDVHGTLTEEQKNLTMISGIALLQISNLLGGPLGAIAEAGLSANSVEEAQERMEKVSAVLEARGDLEAR